MTAREEALDTTRSRRIVGRDELLDRIHLLLRSGFGVTLRGQAGCGKSSVLREIANGAGGGGVDPIVLTASEFAGAVPFGVFLPLIDAADLREIRNGHTGELMGSNLLYLASLVRERVAMTSLLVIDDVHLLDAASAGLVHQLASSGTTILLSVRSGAQVSAAVTALWADDLVRVVAVKPFDEVGSTAMILQLLPGPVDRGLVIGVHAASGGNALFLRELIRASLELGIICRRSGVWVLAEPLPMVDTIVELLRVRLASVDDDVRHAVELVALADSVALDHALRIAEFRVFERAEQAGLLNVDDGAVPRVRLGHPLYRDAAMFGLPRLRRERLYGELLDALDHGQPSETDRVARARWRLELGRSVGWRELLALARKVQSSDERVAEQFLRAAIAEGGHPEARLALVSFLTHHHRLDEIDGMFASLAETPLSKEQSGALAETHAFHLAMAAHRPAEALRVLDTAAAGDWTPGLRAVRAVALWRCGQIDEAMVAADDLLRDVEVPRVVAVSAALTLGMTALYAARSNEVSTALAKLEEHAMSVAPVLPEAPESARLIAAARGSMLPSDLESARRECEAGYVRTLREDKRGERAQYALLLGWNRALAGDLDTAVGLLREADAGIGTFTVATLPWAKSQLVQALVLAGAQNEARVICHDLESMPVAGLYAADVALARSAVLAGDRRRREAISLLAAASADADRLGQRLRAGELRYTALRYGDANSAGAVVRSYARLRNAQGEAIVEHARAVQRQDAPRIESAADALRAAGLLWFAVEAQAAAVWSYRNAREDRTATFAVERLSRMLRDCRGFSSPLVRDQLSSTLTPRESEVAFLVASGMAAAQVAARLGLSVRTVNLHLGHAYSKLGVHSRHELASSLVENDFEKGRTWTTPALRR